MSTLTRDWAKSTKSSATNCVEARWNKSTRSIDVNCVEARWAKSSRSEAGNCVETRWAKSSRSNPSGSCVECRYVGIEIEVRDTKAKGEGPIISFKPHAWQGFVDSLK